MRRPSAATAMFIGPALVLLFVLLGASALPMQDFPEHVHMASVLSTDAADAEPAYDESLAPTSYVGMFWLWRMLSIFFSAETGGRLLVLFYCLACVTSFAFLVRRVRPSVSLAASVAIGWWIPFSFFYYMGFVPYLFTVPLLFLLCAHAYELRRSEEPSGKRPWYSVAKVVGDLTLLYLAHPHGIALGMLVAACTLVVIRSEAGGRKIRWRQWAVIVGWGGVLLALALSQNAGPVSSAMSSEAPASSNVFARDNWSDTAWLAARIPLGPLQGDARALQWAAIALLGAALLCSWSRRRESSGDHGVRDFAILSGVLAVVIFGVSYWLAGSQRSGTIFHRLFIFPYFFLLLAWVSIARWRRVAVVLVAVSALTHLGATVVAHRGYSAEVAPARALMNKMSKGQEAMALFFDRDSAIVKDAYVHTMQHLVAYHPATFGGRYLASPRGGPFPILPRFDASELPRPAEPWRYRPNATTRAIGFVLVRSPSEEVLRQPIMANAFGRVVGSLDAERDLIGREGRWALWGPTQRVAAPAAGAAAAPHGGASPHGARNDPHASITRTPGSKTGAEKGVLTDPIARAEETEGRTIAEVYAQRTSLAGKVVVVRGKVVKAADKIMGRNWLHLQDGSGTTEGNDFDLTVTTSGTAAVGDVVVVRGSVALDRDFGYGYAYSVVIENAEVSTSQ